jgi:hypothetical protein
MRAIHTTQQRQNQLSYEYEYHGDLNAKENNCHRRLNFAAVTQGKKFKMKPLRVLSPTHFKPIFSHDFLNIAHTRIFFYLRFLYSLRIDGTYHA